MILVDVNLLLYAVDSTSPHHERALAWWSGALRGSETIGLPWSTTLAFIRLATNPRVFAAPLDPGTAVTLVRAWLDRPNVVPIDPTGRHLAVLAGLLDATGTAGNLVTDAHLAALAVEHGATLCSADADFARFDGLRWSNPLR